MAGPGVASPGGFSYAQAAKGRVSSATSQAPSSKVTSGVATPATGMLSDLEPSARTNWADDVESTVGEKQQDSTEESSERNKSHEVKGAVERAKSEDKAQHSSGVSSPDLAASATSHDDFSSAQNGSSQTSWEAKSQTSDTAVVPAETSGSWITARAERQSNGPQRSETPAKGRKKKNAEKAPEPEPAPKPVLVEAAAPTINPWAKRAEDNKAKAAAAPQSTAKTAPAPASGAASNLKENLRPRQDTKKPSPTNGGSSDSATAATENKKPASSQGKSKQDARPTSGQGSKTAAGAPRADASTQNNTKPARESRQSLPNLTVAPPSVKDQVSWPTPDTAPAQEKERKSIPEKTTEQNDEDASSTGKPRKKPEWKPVPVVPNIVWETPNVKTGRGGSYSAESRPRGGANVRGRGSARGGASGVANGDRPASRADDAASRRGREGSNDETPTSAKSQRASSTSSWVDVRKSSAGDINNVAQSKDAPNTEELKQASSQLRNTTSSTDVPDADNIPQPIPPRTSQDAQNTQKTDGADAPAGPPIRMVQSDSRKERNGENGRDPNWTGRGAKRTGRGRGGSREVANGHLNGHPYNGSNLAFDPTNAQAFGGPQSPPFQAQRGNHPGAFAGSSRSTWRNNTGRAVSIPMDNMYNRYAQYPAPMQQYAYDQNGYPVSAVPIQPMMDFQYLFGLVSMQLDYYFSFDNLLKDMFLRKNMDSQGFVYLDVIASFNRIKTLTSDRELLRQVCIGSEAVEIRVGEDGKERLRKAREWEKFVLPIDERFPSAKHDGPQKHERPAQRYPDIYGTLNMSSGYQPMPFRINERHSYDSSNALMNGAARGAFFPGGGPPEMNGDEARGRATKSPIQDSSMSAQHQAMLGNVSDSDAEPDVFPEQNLEQLTVCVKMDSRRAPYHTAASRTFSNGSIDTRTIAGEMEKQQNGQSQPSTNGETQANGTSSSTEHGVTSPTHASSPERPAHDVSVFWIKDNDNPVGTLPSGLTPEPYVQLRLKALDQRGHAATGTCPYDLDVLYQFWSHFLIRNFNNRMYTEFKFYAWADSKERASPVGVRNLIKYYSQALLSPNPIPTRVVKDFVEMVRAEGPKAEGSAFRQLRSAWRNGALNLRNRKKVADSIDESLKAQLEA